MRDVRRYKRNFEMIKSPEKRANVEAAFKTLISHFTKNKFNSINQEPVNYILRQSR